MDQIAQYFLNYKYSPDSSVLYSPNQNPKFFVEIDKMILKLWLNGLVYFLAKLLSISYNFYWEVDFIAFLAFHCSKQHMFQPSQWGHKDNPVDERGSISKGRQEWAADILTMTQSTKVREFSLAWFKTCYIAFSINSLLLASGDD